MADVPDAVVVESRHNEEMAENYNSKHGRVYTGDLVVFKSRSPWDWSPTYGTVVRHNFDAPSSKLNKINDSALITVEEQAETQSSLKINEKDGDTKSIGKSRVNDADNALNVNFTVHWDTSNRVRQMKRSEVCIIDRMLVRGTRVRNNENISGTVTNYNVKATLQIVGTNHIIQGVALNELHPISPYVRGQEVLFRDWVGIITNVKRVVWFRLDGGLTFHVETTESDGFMKTDPYWGLGVACPGVRVPFSSSVLKNAKWSSKYMRWLWKWVPPISFLYSFASATVTRVDASAVTVKWLAPAPNATQASETPPACVLDRSQMTELQILSMPNSEYGGLNSVRVYKLKPEDHMTTYGAWFSQFRHKFMEQSSNRSYSNFFLTPTTPLKHLSGNGKDVPVKILLRHNYVDILWDNGTTEGMSSIDVPFVYEPKCHESLRSGMVVLSENHPPESKLYGIVQMSEDLIEQGTNTVRVHWYGEGTEKERIVHDEGVTEESVYSLKAHPSYSLFQRETILFSTDPNFHEFNAGIVIDVDVRQGNMIVHCTDSKYRTVWPHMVTPFAKRCSWNFFTRKWVIDDIIPPPHQLGVEQYPNTQLPHSLVETEEAIVKLKEDHIQSRGLWQEPPFDILEHAPENHWYIKPDVEVVDADLAKIVRGEFDLMRSNIPLGVSVRVYENRMDLVSVMIVGPAKTPYEDGLFFFDMKLPTIFPKVPPKVHSIAYSNEIHPLVADDGNFCEMNLKWKYNSDEEEEALQPRSHILEAIETIHGFFHTREPYSFLMEDRALSDGTEISRSYNELIFLQVLDIYYKVAIKPHDPWKSHIAEHVTCTLPQKLAMIEKWCAQKDGKENAVGSSSHVSNLKIPQEPSYPLLPFSKGFELTLENKLKNLRAITAICGPGEKVRVEEKVEFTPVKKESQSLIHTIEDIFHGHGGGAEKIEKKEKGGENEEEQDGGFSIADF